MCTKQWNIQLRFKKVVVNARNMQKIIEKGCFLAKTFMGKEAKKDQERQNRGGRLLGQGRILGTIRYYK